MKTTNSKIITGGIYLIFLYMLPYLILGENAYVTIHDFLDQNVVIMATLKKTGLLTSINGVVPNMGGLDRALFPFFAPFDIKMLCYLLLPTYWAIVVYTFVYKAIAFLGMYLLIDTYIFQGKNKVLACLLSLGFAFVPFYMELALSGAGFPLVTWAFLNLYHNKNKVWSYIAIAFYTFNSLLAYGGFFFMAVLFCCMVYVFCCTKKISQNVFYGALLMGVVYIIANWGTFYSLFFSESFVSHRSEWVHYTPLKADVVEFFKIILFSQYHAGTLIAAPILLLYLFVWVKFRKRYTILNKVLFVYLIIVVGILIGMLLKLSHLQIFVSVQFDRFYFFYPSIVIMLLATICHVLIQENRLKWAIVLAVFGLFSGVVFDKEMKNNTKLLVHKQISEPTFRQFYDTELFDEVCSYLQVSPDYKTKTVSVGMFPAVAEYNGFYTLDSYRVNYPLEYKQEFRKIIASELDKSAELKDYYDKWGSRCYVFSSELKRKYMFGKDCGVSIHHLDINTEQLRKMGCQYVLSAVPILNYEELDWDFEKSFTTDRSYWKIYLYKI
jgi:hypothetical protein